MIAHVAEAVQVVADTTSGTSAEPIWVSYILPREMHPSEDSIRLVVYENSQFPWHPPEVRFDVHLGGLDENAGRFA